jgi:integrase
MLVPLVGEVLEILTRRRLTASSVFVFPSYGKTGHMVEPKAGWDRIKKTAGLVDVRLHDLRRTMGSYQTISGASTAIVGKTLGHKSPASTAVYARMTLDPVRESMEKAVALMKTPVEKKVVNISGKQ